LPQPEAPSYRWLLAGRTRAWGTPEFMLVTLPFQPLSQAIAAQVADISAQAAIAKRELERLQTEREAADGEVLRLAGEPHGTSESSASSLSVTRGSRHSKVRA